MDLSTHTLSVSASTLSPAPSIPVTLTVPGASTAGTNLYWGYWTSGTGINTVTAAPPNGDSVLLHVEFQVPSSPGLGTYPSTLYLEVATDQAGAHPIGNSPQAIDVTYNVIPPLAITAPAAVEGGSAGNSASVPAQAGLTYAWTIAGGSITAGSGTDQITFMAGPSGQVVLGCAVYNADGTYASQGTVTTTIVSLPSITGFTANPDIVSLGQGTQLVGTFTGGLGTIDPGLGPVTSGTPVDTGPLESTTSYTLTVTNSLGTAVQAACQVVAAPGKFTPTSGQLGTSRGGQAANLLQSGAVLLTGGYSCPNGPFPTFLSGGELFNPVLGTFTPATGGLADGKSGLEGVTLADGTLLFAGGYGFGQLGPDEHGITSWPSADLFLPSIGAYTPTGPLSTSRDGSTLTLLPDGRILVAGGYSYQAEAVLGSAEIYDPESGTFSLVAAAMTAAREGHCAVLLPAGQVLLLGGAPTAFAERYDPVGGTFTSTLGSMIQPRDGATATLLPDGKVLVCAGYLHGTVNLLASAELYDPSTDRFTPTSGSLNVPRSGCQAILMPNGKVLLIGGNSGSGDPLVNGEWYDPATGAFTLVPYLETSRAGFSATLLGSGQVLVAGGATSTGQTSASAGLFDPQDPAPGFPCVIYVPQVYPLTVGNAMNPSAPVGSGATTWSISPALPPGLALDPGTGVLSGQPTAPSPTTPYTVTANNGTNSSSTFLWITVK
jgi:hypothetical protein